MLEGGGRHIEDLREIRDDEALRTMIGLSEMPSLSTYGDWLARTATSKYTLDVDATVIEAEKREAAWTYKKVKGYQPILGFLAENGLCLTHEFRAGNVAAHAQALKFLKRCVQLCPKIKRVRSDSAFYQADVINWCQKRGLGFTISADQDVGLKEVIKTVRDWTPLQGPNGEETDREVGTAIHMLTKTKESFRLIVQRWRDPQLALFEPNEYCYYVITTNLDDLAAEEVVWFHNQRGQVENLIKEVKIGFGMEQMTSGEFPANALWFALGLLAYNLTQAQKLIFLDPEWRTKTIATLRWQLIETAGRVIRHGRRLILRLATTWEKYALFLQTRRRLKAFGEL